MDTFHYEYNSPELLGTTAIDAGHGHELQLAVWSDEHGRLHVEAIDAHGATWRAALSSDDYPAHAS